MVKIICDKATERLWMQTIIETGLINVRKEYFEELMEKYGMNKTCTVQFEKSENFINDLKGEIKNG